MLKPDTQKIKLQIEQRLQSRAITAAIWKDSKHKRNNIFRSVYERQQHGCMHVTKATIGVISSEKHSRKEAQTRLLCVFNTPPELQLERRETKKMENCWRLSSTAKMRTIQFLFVCVYVCIQKKSNNTDCTAIDYDGCSHSTQATRGLLVTSESTYERKS